MSPILDRYYLQNLRYYDTHAAAYANAVESQAPLPEVGKFLQYVPKNGRVIDVGCGSGRDTRIFHNLGYDVVGVDIAERLLEEARRRSPALTFKKMDMRTLRFPKESIDGIWASSSLSELHKLSDVDRTLRAFNKVMKFGGILHLRVKSPSKPAVRIELVEDDLVKKSTGQTERYLRYFTKAGLVERVRKAGFTVKEAYVYDHEQRHTDNRKLRWVVVFAVKK